MTLIAQMGIPEGWAVERDDPSVGIFGWFYWHDACESGKDADGIVADRYDLSHEYQGYGSDRYIVYTVRLTCRACRQSVQWHEREWDPLYDDDSYTLWADEEAARLAGEID